MTPTLAALLALQAAPAASPPQSGPDTQVVVTAQRPTPGDPEERFNRRMFRAQQKADRKVVGPAARGYKRAVPGFLRGAIRNVLRNLGEPVVFVNFLLQHRVGKAVETATRFLVNSTLGLGGTMDVAKGRGVKLPFRPNGFADTMGFYGVGPGPYFFLPLIGPTTVRDLIGNQADGLLLPLAVGKPFNRAAFAVPAFVLGGLDQRAEADADLHALLDDAVDPYATLRSVYLQDRAGEIAALHGPGWQPKRRRGDDVLGDPLADPGVAPATGGPAELGDPLADPAAADAAPVPAPAPAPAGLDDPLTDPAAAPAAAPAAPVRR